MKILNKPKPHRNSIIVELIEVYQVEHHRKKNLKRSMLNSLINSKSKYDEKYLFDWLY